MPKVPTTTKQHSKRCCFAQNDFFKTCHDLKGRDASKRYHKKFRKELLEGDPELADLGFVLLTKEEVCEGCRTVCRNWFGTHAGKKLSEYLRSAHPAGSNLQVRVTQLQKGVTSARRTINRYASLNSRISSEPKYLSTRICSAPKYCR